MAFRFYLRQGPWCRSVKGIPSGQIQPCVPVCPPAGPGLVPLGRANLPSPAVAPLEKTTDGG